MLWRCFLTMRRDWRKYWSISSNIEISSTPLRYSITLNLSFRKSKKCQNNLLNKSNSLKSLNQKSTTSKKKLLMIRGTKKRDPNKGNLQNLKIRKPTMNRTKKHRRGEEVIKKKESKTNTIISVRKKIVSLMIMTMKKMTLLWKRSNQPTLNNINKMRSKKNIKCLQGEIDRKPRLIQAVRRIIDQWKKNSEMKC